MTPHKSLSEGACTFCRLNYGGADGVGEFPVFWKNPSSMMVRKWGGVFWLEIDLEFKPKTQWLTDFLRGQEQIASLLVSS